jgi:hypothetical protein
METEEEKKKRLAEEAEANSQVVLPEEESIAAPRGRMSQAPTDISKLEAGYVTKQAEAAQEHINAEWEGTPIDIETLMSIVTPGQANWAYMDGKMLLIDSATNDTYDVNEISKSVKDHAEVIRMGAGDVVADRFLKKAAEGFSPRQEITFTAASARIPIIKELQDSGQIPSDYDVDSIGIIKNSVPVAQLDSASAAAAKLLSDGKTLPEAVSVASARLIESDEFSSAPVPAKLWMVDQLLNGIDSLEKQLDQQTMQQISRVYENVKGISRQAVAKTIVEKDTVFFIQQSPAEAKKALEQASLSTRTVTAENGKIKQNTIALSELNRQLSDLTYDPLSKVSLEDAKAKLEKDRDRLTQRSGSMSKAEFAAAKNRLDDEERALSKNEFRYGTSDSNPLRRAKEADLRFKISQIESEINVGKLTIEEEGRKANLNTEIGTRGQRVELKDAMHSAISGIMASTESQEIVKDIMGYAAKSIPVEKMTDLGLPRGEIQRRMLRCGPSILPCTMSI